FQTFYQSTAIWANSAFEFPGHVVTNLNSPLMMLAVWPFTWLPYDAAFRLWTTLSILATCVASAVIARTAGMSVLDVVLLTFSLAGALIAFALGQVTALLTVVFTIAWLADRNGYAVVAGCCLGVLCLLKPFYGLFLLYQAWRRQWRTVISSVLTGCVGAIIAFAMVGSAGVQEWIVKLRSVGWHAHLYNGSVWGVADRLFTGSGGLRAASWTPLVVAPRVAFGL